MADKQQEIDFKVNHGERELADWIQSYAQFTEGTEAPAEFHSWTAVSTIAGALGRKCWVDMGVFQLYPCFYIIFVAPPGIATKSTTAGIGMELLDKSKTSTVFTGSVTWQAIMDTLQDCAKQVDINGKKLEMSSLHVFASELGTLLKKDDFSMIDMLVDIWDGKSKVERRTRGSGLIEIARPFVNLVGCTTPAWLADYAQSYMIDGGFFSRTLFVYGDAKKQLIAYPTGFKQIELKSELENDLKRIGQLRGEFVLDDDAKAWGTLWYHDTWNNPPSHIAGDKFQSYRARRQAHLHKLAMVVSAARGNSMVITMDDLSAANALLVNAEWHLHSIHDSIMSRDNVQGYKAVVRSLKSYKTIGKSALFKELATRLSFQEFEQGVAAAVFTGEIKQAQKGNQIYLQYVEQKGEA